MAETPTFLASNEWMTVPWRKTPKDDYHRFLDILVQIPTIMYIANALVKGQDTASMGVQSVEHVLGTMRQMDQAMNKWYAHMQGKHGSLYKAQPVKSGSDTPFSEEFAYTEFYQSQALFGVWHGKMQLFHTTCQLRGLKKPSEDADPRQAFTAQELADAVAIADNICKVSNFALRHANTVLGAQFIMLPLKSAAECYAFNGMPGKQMWCFQKIGHILAQRFGLRGRME